MNIRKLFLTLNPSDEKERKRKFLFPKEESHVFYRVISNILEPTFLGETLFYIFAFVQKKNEK